MSRAVIYMRCSRQEQADSRLGLESQRALCKAAVAKEALALLDVFSDEAVSGSLLLAERAEGLGLIELIGAKKANVVVALSLDRLFRSMLDALGTLERWRELGVRLYLVDGGWVDFNDDDSWTKFVIKAFVAELELRNVRKRTTRALKAARDRGTPLGGVPLGFRSVARVVGGRKVDAGVRVEVPEETAVIARVRLLRSGDAPLSYREIARRFNAEQVPTRRGGTWGSETVRKIARREP